MTTLEIDRRINKLQIEIDELRKQAGLLKKKRDYSYKS